MKAYQIKVGIKDSKPPVWWRCYVPEGITFSSLSLILNAVTGQENGQTFCFTFRNKARVFEPDDAHPLVFDYMHDAADASGVYLPEYFDSVKTYLYTVGNACFRIAIEADIPKYSLDYPAISKMKISIGMDGHALAEKVKTGFLLRSGKPVWKSTVELLQNTENGAVIIPCTSKPQNREGAIKKSSEKQLRELGALLRKATRSGQDFSKPFLVDEDEEPSSQSMHDLLSKYPRKDLMEIAVRLEIPGRTGMNTDKLLNELTTFLLEPVIIRRDFCCIGDRELEEFEKALAWEGESYPVNAEQIDLLNDFCYLGYLFFAKTNDKIYVPKELKEIYPTVNNENFQEKRKKVRWIIQIMNDIVPVYYGEIPLRKFCRLCRRTEDPVINSDEVPALLKLIPQDYVESALVGEMIRSNYYQENPEELEDLRSMQKDKPFYIMRQKEIEDLLRYGYPDKDVWYRKFRRFLIEKKQKSEEEADSLLKNVHELIALHYSSQDVMNTLEYNDVIPDGEEINDYMKIYQGLVNNSPCLYNRGYAPSML